MKKKATENTETAEVLKEFKETVDDLAFAEAHYSIGKTLRRKIRQIVGKADKLTERYES